MDLTFHPLTEERWPDFVRLFGEQGGLLAYIGSEPVGWCAVAPREAYPALQRSPSRRAVDERSVWSISCVYVSRSHRRQHLSTELIKAAVAYVRAQGGRIVEGYPVPPKRNVASTNYAFTGFVSAFEQAGFTEWLRRSKTRPIMRYQDDALQPAVASGRAMHKVPAHKGPRAAAKPRRR
jgi:GNAT superfamily N-acetyltransferase